MKYEFIYLSISLAPVRHTQVEYSGKRNYYWTNAM